MKQITISSSGALIEGSKFSRNVISLTDNSFLGGHDPQYWPGAKFLYQKGVEIALRKFRPVNAAIPSKSITIPTRYHWDDCFNHLSFQSMPIIGLVYEFHRHLFYSAYWHTSRFTAALLLLLGVEFKNLIIEEHVFAKSVVLPWVPYWNPTETASLRGISRNISLTATQTLLSKTFPDVAKQSIPKVVPMNYRYENIDLNESGELSGPERFVVYFNRSAGGKRTVDNELEILTALHKHLRPEYKLLVLPPFKEYKTIKQLHIVWQQYARIVNRAIVIIGPHGKFLLLVIL